MSRLDLDELKAYARAATKEASRWVYHTHYIGGDETISVREPNDHTIHLSHLHSWNYAKLVGCTTQRALAHLTKLAEAGLIKENKGWSGTRDFALSRDESVQIGREIIAELRATGLPFDDEWRAAREAA